MIKHLRHHLGALIALLALGLGGLAWGLADGLWLCSIVGTFVAILAISWLYALYGQNTRKVAFMLDAITNNDFAFRYPMNGHSPDDRLVSETLTRIAQLLSKARAETIQQEKYYELILNSVKTGVLVIDDRGFIYQKNREALRLLGVTVLTHIFQLDRVEPHLSKAFIDALPGEKTQVAFTTERGTTRLSLRVSEITLRKKHLRIGAINDFQSELDEKEIDSWVRLTRVLTHEIMNRETREGLEVISSTGKSLMRFVENYRQFTHIPTPRPGLVDLRPFLDRLVQLAIHQGDYAHVKTVIDVEPDDLILYADEDLIARVVLNLLKNAFQAIGESRRDGLILLRARSDERGAITIEFSNNGPCIPPEEAEQIFVPFFTTKEDGNGIGLSISRQIMRLSGGSIELRQDVAAGLTTFVLIFP